jgi:uncharacterized protein YcnI
VAHTHQMTSEMRECIQNCLNCYAICLETAHHCLTMGGKHADPEHIGLLKACAEDLRNQCRFHALRVRVPQPHVRRVFQRSAAPANEAARAWQMVMRRCSAVPTSVGGAQNRASEWRGNSRANQPCAGVVSVHCQHQHPIMRSFQMNRRLASFVCLFTLTFTIGTAYGHVTVRPREAVAGASQKYTMRVPTEKAVATVRIEIEFPAEIEITSVDEAPGWKIETKKDASGKPASAVWSGASIPPKQVAEFTFIARNPREETKLVWKVVQIYEDGSRSEWTGPQGTRTPASVTTVKSATATPSTVP